MQTLPTEPSGKPVVALYIERNTEREGKYKHFKKNKKQRDIFQMKKQDKTSGEKKFDETKTTNLPDKNFKSNGHKDACQTYKTR